jgi:hypothetical protein
MGRFLIRELVGFAMIQDKTRLANDYKLWLRLSKSKISRALVQLAGTRLLRIGAMNWPQSKTPQAWRTPKPRGSSSDRGNVPRLA